MKKKGEGFNYDHFLGKTLADVRDRSGCNQKLFAEKMKISQSVLSRMESGERKIKENELFKICEALGVTVTAFTSEACERYQAHLQEIAPKKDEPEEPLPDHPLALQVVEIFDRYTQSRHEKERELLLGLLRYMEKLKATP